MTHSCARRRQEEKKELREICRESLWSVETSPLATSLKRKLCYKEEEQNMKERKKERKRKRRRKEGIK
jgi:hypothetical protein